MLSLFFYNVWSHNDVLCVCLQVDRSELHFFASILFKLKDLLVRTMEDYVSLFMEANRLRLPMLKMELTFDDRCMQFYPPVVDLEDTILLVVSRITQCMQQVLSVTGQLLLAGTPVCV